MEGIWFAGGIAGKEDWVVGDMKDEELEGIRTPYLYSFNTVARSSGVLEGLAK